VFEIVVGRFVLACVVGRNVGFRCADVGCNDGF
jgi:hypothetical protein